LTKPRLPSYAEARREENTTKTMIVDRIEVGSQAGSSFKQEGYSREDDTPQNEDMNDFRHRRRCEKSRV